MKTKLIAISVFLLLALMVPPVLAKPIGPHKAVGKNPHLMPTPEGVELIAPSGGFHSWTNDTEFWYMDFTHGLDASKAKGIIHKALTLTIVDIMELMTNETVALEAENNWGYVSYDALVELFILEGYSEEDAIEMASKWPEGVFVRFVNVGK